MCVCPCVHVCGHEPGNFKIADFEDTREHMEIWAIRNIIPGNISPSGKFNQVGQLAGEQNEPARPKNYLKLNAGTAQE